jgi:hypothetical protein
MIVYVCRKCGFKTTEATHIYLMADGETEYCEPCYELKYGV